VALTLEPCLQGKPLLLEPRLGTEAGEALVHRERFLYSHPFLHAEAWVLGQELPLEPTLEPALVFPAAV
jgi:hypothetical protein